MSYRDKDCPCASGVYSSDAREILAAVHAQNLASLNAAALRDRYRRVNGIALPVFPHIAARAWRESQGMSRAKLARWIGFSPSQIQDYEEGNYIF